MNADLLIKNVEIIDGTGADGFFGSVAVCEGKICAVIPKEYLPQTVKDGKKDAPVLGEWEHSLEAVSVIDGNGLALAPGFIDVHSHGDMVAGHDYARLCKISQGITTEIAGQCGTSCFPITPESKDYVISNSVIIGDQIEEHLDSFHNLEGFKAYLNTCGLSANMMVFMGHSALRMAVMGSRMQIR